MPSVTHYFPVLGTFNLRIILDLFILCLCFTYMHIHALCVWLVPAEVREGHWISGNKLLQAVGVRN